MSGAHAAGFGKITILSSLGQPLRAEIELTSVAKDEESQLVAKLASADAYKQANIEFNPALLSLQFSIDQRGARKFVRVTSSQPINEPFVAVLIELGGSKNRVLREYNVLLDPADARSTQSPQITAPARAAASVSTTTSSSTKTTTLPSGARNDRTPSPSVEKKTAQADRAAGSATKPSEAGGGKSKPGDTDYRVKKGDTLFRIAVDNLQNGVSLDQMLLAMYRGNERAFIDKNINRLRSGQILAIPDADTARSVPRAEASNVVLGLSKDFHGYRNTLATQTAAASPREATEAKQSGGGKISAKVQEQANPANDAKDKLKLSRAGDIAKPDANPTAAAVAATEEKIAREKAAVEANARVKELEKNIMDLQKVLDVKSKNLDELQKQTSSIGKTSPPVAPATPPAATGSATSAAVAAATSTPNPAAVASNASSATTTDAAASVAASDAAPAAVVTSPVVAVAAKPVIKPAAPKAIPEAPPESSFIDSVTDNPLLPAVGILALLLAGLGIHRFRRKKQQAFLDSGGVPLTGSGLKSNSLFGSTGGQSVDTKNSIFNSSFVPSVSSLDTNVDPVAEADVYIAYGRDVQAEEILKEALRSQPNRHAIRVKLLEIYATRKDVRAFEIVASELYSLTNGVGEEWQQAIALGAAVDPTNPLYGHGMLTEQVVAKAASITAPTQPLDGLDFNALNAVTEPYEPKSNFLESKQPEATELFAPLSADELSHKAEALIDGAQDLDLHFKDANKFSSLNTDAVNVPSVPESTKSVLESLDFELGNNGSQAPHFSLPSASSTEKLIDPSISARTKTIEHVTAPVALASPLEFDLSGMDLDLGDIVEKYVPTKDVASKANVVSNAEMATKLDLAVAYQEIGDNEGARELLEEVLKGGDVAQVSTAKILLQNLA
ncbi:pilus assembly protein FimV [Glaciimonas sp. PCH181]|nr:pilus assembly protein FimV [Glaciimonas sp. PCH181]